MNYSRQRQIILNVLEKSKSHPTAEEILSAVRQEDEKVARGTVYRNLGLLVECGDVIKITTPEGICRYDYIHTTHSHAVCEVCGRVTDIFPEDTREIMKLLQRCGFHPSNSSISVGGVCAECYNNKLTCDKRD